MPSVVPPQSACHLGLARREVTPPAGIYHRMWGAATHDRATGVHRPLTATAVTFRATNRPAAAEAEQIVVALDHCLLWAAEADALRAAVAAGAGVATEPLLIAFSHTHAAGLMDRSRAALPGGERIGPYLDDLAGRIADAVREARADAVPAVLTYGTGRCTLATHRDFWDEARGGYVCGYNPGGPADDTVLVARATAADGRPLATFVNYACHPTTLAWENTLISPDYPGAMRELVERETRVPCIFLQGASGDLGPREGFVGDPAVADRNGRQLGFAALGALEALPPPDARFAYAGAVVSGATLGSWQYAPLDESARARRARWRCRRWTLDLPYRPGLPTAAQTTAERIRRLAEEEAARRAGDTGKARDAHALVERLDRQLTRLAALPPGETFPYPIALWQVGDAIWVAVEAEPYQDFQHRLRERFPGVPIMVMAIANAYRATYLPPAGLYGTGLYQESVAVLAPGCLERLTEAVGDQIAAWQTEDR